MTEPAKEQLAAAAEAANLGAQMLLKRAPFANRGLSARTIQALIDCSIDAPERLLFMTNAEIRKVPGVGKASLAEIARYRAKFEPAPEPMSELEAARRILFMLDRAERGIATPDELAAAKNIVSMLKMPKPSRGKK